MQNFCIFFYFIFIDRFYSNPFLMKANILSIIILYFCVSSVSYAQQQVTINQINAEISKGNFDKSKKMIDLYIAQNSLSSEEIYNLNFKERCAR
jgi:hypothetical protein